MRNEALNKLGAVLSAADQGVFELPPDVVSARAALARLSAAESPLPGVDSTTALAGLVDALVAAADTLKPTWPKPDALMAALVAEDTRRVWASARESALVVAADRVVVTVQNSADQIITGTLCAAIEQVLAEAAEHAAAFAPVAELNDTQLLAAKDEHRLAALALDRLAARYSVLRRVQGVLSAGRVQRDTSGLWAEVGNLRELYGNRWPGRNQSAWRPGPDGARARAAWLAVGDPAEPVRPQVVTLTPGERDERWLAAFEHSSGVQATSRGGLDLVSTDSDG